MDNGNTTTKSSSILGTQIEATVTAMATVTISSKATTTSMPQEEGGEGERERAGEEGGGENTTTIADLRANNTLWYKLHVFIFDLHHFASCPASQARLDSIIDASYLGLPYFTAAEAAQIKNTKTEDNSTSKSGVSMTLEESMRQTMEERMQRRMARHAESGDFRVCAAHDLAPILERALRVRWKDVKQDKAFRALMDEHGLTLPEGQVWGGLVGGGGGNNGGGGEKKVGGRDRRRQRKQRNKQV